MGTAASLRQLGLQAKLRCPSCESVLDLPPESQQDGPQVREPHEYSGCLRMVEAIMREGQQDGPQVRESHTSIRAVCVYGRGDHA